MEKVPNEIEIEGGKDVIVVMRVATTPVLPLSLSRTSQRELPRERRRKEIQRRKEMRRKGNGRGSEFVRGRKS